MTQSDDIYFAPLLPWQQGLWEQLTARVLTADNLPHALLAAGMTGMGKRAFIWRFVAWLLCRMRDSHPLGACAQCESCQWLKSGTHPSLQVLPSSQLPINAERREGNDAQKSSTKKTKKNDNTAKTIAIKIDDIRALQPFIYQGGQGMRICVLDHAEQMTIAAANALLKTLEEPQAQVHLFLISDKPAMLLPTIKSRVQMLPLQTITPTVALDYVTRTLGSTVNRAPVSPAQMKQLLQLANGAPLAAIHLAQADWYDMRALWLTTWQALYSGKRSSLAASDYWQSKLSLDDFMALTELMLLDIRRVGMGLTAVQQDVNLPEILAAYQPTDSSIEALMASLQQIKRAQQQNVQDKLAYDKLMQALAPL